MFGKIKTDTNPEKIERLLTRGVSEVIDREHLKKQLLSGKQLRVKLGFDPTGAKIHIGRAIVLRKLREFQDLGHKVVFIVGDFTALIGDPSDKLDKRPQLTEEAIKENLKHYKEQVGKIIDLKKAEFVFNSTWLTKLNLKDILDLQHVFSVNQMLARRNFSERLEKHGEIGLYETTYPLMQGYDSVMVKADVEIGGFDQLFNLKAGRLMQERFKQPQQDILMGEMLEGTDGRKMSTSWGNVINITDEPNDMFGKVMSIGDGLIQKHFILCTDLSLEEIRNIENLNPKDQKVRLANEIVRIYHGEKAAVAAQQEFDRVHAKGEMPADIPEVAIHEHAMNLIGLLYALNISNSRSELRRLIEQGGVRIAGAQKKDPQETIAIDDGMVVQVGPRRFVKIIRR